MLLKMKEFKIALTKSLETLNPDFYFLCSIHMKLEEMIPLLQDPIFLSIKNYLLSDPVYASRYYFETKDHEKLGMSDFRQMHFIASLSHMKQTSLHFETNIIEQMVEINKEYPDTFSLSSLISKLLKEGKIDEAKGVSIKYGMSVKKFKWIHLKHLISKRNFSESDLESLKLEESHIEYLLNDEKINKEDAYKWILKLKNSESKIYFFMKFGHLTNAIELAFEEENVIALENIASKTTNQATKSMIQGLISKCK